MPQRVLIVDDEAGIRDSLSGILADEGYRVATAASASEARQGLAERAADLVLLDLWLPDDDGMELLAELQGADPDLPVVVISGHGNIDAAVTATRLGAYDFLEKPLALERVLLTVQNAFERVRMTRNLEQLSSRYQPTEELIGDSSAMRRLKHELERAARSEGRILIIGENGTGKELVARRVHRLSPRASAAFVEVNCAAIPGELIESELFGHVRGSFTGAAADRAGRFEQADGGTLFLDEIADMSLATQAKVLRVLQEQRFERVGGSSSIQVDVRVLAATNKDLQEEIAAGRFREDLYFRLAVIPLDVPPLRRRTADVPLLVEHFLARYAAELGHRPKRFTAAAVAHLERYPWPGNVRELRNFVERMTIMVAGDEIDVRHLPPAIRHPGDVHGAPVDEQDFPSLRAAREAFEKRFIERRLAESGGNVARAARALDLERSHLYRKLKTYSIEIDRHRQQPI